MNRLARLAIVFGLLASVGGCSALDGQSELLELRAVTEERIPLGAPTEDAIQTMLELGYELQVPAPASPDTPPIQRDAKVRFEKSIADYSVPGTRFLRVVFVFYKGRVIARDFYDGTIAL